MMRCYCALALLLLGAPTCGLADTPEESHRTSSGAGWIRLFNGNSLDGWYIKIQNRKKNDDPAGFFQVHDGVIHVYKDQPDGSPVPNGYIATEAEYAYYHLRMEYKWGAKKFKPRVAARRDAGLIYHVVAPDVVWPRCLECQIQENDVGDCFTVRGAQVVASVETVNVETPGGVKQLPRYKPEAKGGVPKKIGDSGIARIVKSSTHEHDGWNTVEIIVRGREQVEHIVNDQTVFRAKDLKQLGPAPILTPLSAAEKDKLRWEPLAHGRIALQCEYAEVFYRNIEIRPIPGGPLTANGK
jgi:hypothetical protein